MTYNGLLRGGGKVLSSWKKSIWKIRGPRNTRKILKIDTLNKMLGFTTKIHAYDLH